jgi:tetratricopeptide (TPR) repeat protein
LEAIELTRNYSWEKAILIYFEVEKILGLASSLAPWAALQAVLLQVTLGDFTQALMDITRIENTYLSIMDPETKAELHIVKGWVNYYQGNYAQAETCFSEPLAIALETGTERLAKDAEHFLGRLYCDWGQSFSQKQQNESLFHNSKSHLEEAYRLHSKFGTEINQAFDLFRKAQLQQVRNNAREARQLRDTARQMFGKDKAVLHIDMEEAKIAVADREYVESKVKAERALSGWSEVKYAKGIADSIKILGEANYIQGKLAPALELFLASLCIYPYKNLANQQLWTKIIQLKSIILQQVNRNGYEKIMLQIQESMNERSGYFSYLNRLIVDRTPDISQILSRWDEVNKKNKLSNCPIYSLG